MLQKLQWAGIPIAHRPTQSFNVNQPEIRVHELSSEPFDLPRRHRAENGKVKKPAKLPVVSWWGMHYA